MVPNGLDKNKSLKLRESHQFGVQLQQGGIMRPPYKIERLPEYEMRKFKLIQQKQELERQLKFTNLAIGHLREAKKNNLEGLSQ